MKSNQIEQKLTHQIRARQTNRRKRAQEKAQETDRDTETHLFVHSGIPHSGIPQKH